MKSRLSLLILCSLTLSLNLPATVHANDKTESTQTEQKKNVTIVVLTATPEAVHAATLPVLASIGCDIKKDSPTSIEGKRPNKMGLAVGSGGEKLFIELKDVGEGKTELKVTTKKTMVGMMGQKLWNEEVATQIANALK